MSERTSIYLKFSDWDLGQLVADSPPPDGVTISKPQHLIEASAASGGIFLSIVISFAVGVSSSLVAAWLFACFKKSGKARSTINKEEVIFEERHVVRFVENEVFKYHRHTTERKDDDDDRGKEWRSTNCRQPSSAIHMTNIFIASSTAAKAQAKAFIKGCCREGVAFLPWWDEITAGRTLLDELKRIGSKVHRAIVILSPESDTKLRGRKQPIPNLNVLFEFGFFYSALGPDNVAVVRYGQVYLPSDLDGYIHIIGSKRFTRGGAVKVGKQTKTEFERWLNAQNAILEAVFERHARANADERAQSPGTAT